MSSRHELTPDGESTVNWACREDGFFGSVRQLVNCARCGDGLRGGGDTPHRYRDIFKPTMHFLCDPCYEGLPQ